MTKPQEPAGSEVGRDEKRAEATPRVHGGTWEKAAQESTVEGTPGKDPDDEPDDSGTPIEHGANHQGRIERGTD